MILAIIIKPPIKFIFKKKYKNSNTKYFFYFKKNNSFKVN
ncbi:hypothetical protein BSPA14S_0942 [Borreliella spielmanii A14S]|uniref:Uncharacterized protein n=1 Tax=Borreliella spielmanii A14S TaxID=498742 RepID=B9X7S5_9SPIR|nr:hypothetical protein BSPA14S_0942 [Borreliella spielmanii A14S]